MEKDYVLGWMLAAIAAAPELTETWVFKGGTCLRTCFYETYRFSEDLDFTIINRGPEALEDLWPIFGGVRDWLFDRSGRSWLTRRLYQFSWRLMRTLGRRLDESTRELRGGSRHSQAEEG